MPSIDDIRKKYPNAEGYSDDELIDFVTQKSGASRQSVLGAFGVRNEENSDLYNSLKIGVQEVPSGLANLADIALEKGVFEPYLNVAKDFVGGPVVDTLTDQIGNVTGFTPSKWAEENEAMYSDDYFAAQQELQDAQKSGSLMKEAGAYISNPSLITNLGARSLPAMAAGGAIGRGLKAFGASGAAAAGAGEAAISAGMSLADYEGDEYQRAVDSALLSGAAVGLLGYGGGRIADKFGLGNIDMLSRGTGSPRGRLSRMALGAGQEALEELPQSIVEQMGANYANRDPLTEGTGSAALAGGLTGGLMGGAINMLSRTALPPEANDLEDLGLQGDFGSPETFGASEEPSADTPQGLPNYAGETLVSFPDGSVGTEAQVEEFISSLPEAEQIPARARLLGMGSQQTPLTEARLSPEGKVTFDTVKDIATMAGVEKIPAPVRKWIRKNVVNKTPQELVQLRNRDLTDSQLGVVQALDEYFKFDQMEIPAPDIGGIVRASLTEAQAEFWRTRLDPLTEGKSDSQIAKALGYTRQNVTKLKKASINSAVKAVTKELNVSSKEAQKIIDDFIRSTSTNAQATESVVGTAPENQTQVFEEGGDAIGMVDSPQDSQISIGENTTPPGYDQNDVTPTLKATLEAEASRSAFLAQLMRHPEAKNAMNDWEDTNDSVGSPKTEWAMLPLETKAEWVAAYIETLELAQSNDWDSDAFVNALETEFNDAVNSIGEKNETLEILSTATNTSETVGENPAESPRENAQARPENVSSVGQTSPTTETDTGANPADIILQLDEIANGNNPRSSAIAADFLDRARAEEDVFQEAAEWVNAVNQDSLDSRGRPLNEAEISSEGVSDAISDFEAAGLSRILENLRNLTTAPLKESTLGKIFPAGQNAFDIVLSERLMQSGKENNIAHVLRHELSHGLDLAMNWGLSMNAKMTLRVKNGVIEAKGSVAKEITNFYNGTPMAINAKGLKTFLKYPMDIKSTPNLTGPDIQAELFAQLQSAWVTKQGRPIIEKYLPKTAQFLSEANEYAKNQFQDTGTGRSQETPNDETGGVAGRPGRESRGDSSAEQNEETNTKPRAAVGGGLDGVNNSTEKTKEIFKAIGYKMKNLGPDFLTFTQLAEQFGKNLKTLIEQKRLQDEMVALQVKLRDKGHRLLEDWNSLANSKKATFDKMSKIMNAATRLGIHPDRAFDAEGNKHLNTETQRANHQKLSAAYRSLPADARKIYQEALGILAENWKLRQQIFAEVVTQAYEPRITDAKKRGDADAQSRLEKEAKSEIDRHAEEIKKLKGPYFPLMRFGDYILVAESKRLKALRAKQGEAEGESYKKLSETIAKLEKDPNHYIVEAFESRVDLDKRTVALGKKFETRQTMADKYAQEIRPVTSGAINKLNESLDNSVDSKAAAALKDLVTKMYVSSLPEHHALQRQIKRKGIAGATDNMMRSFGEAVERDSFYLSRLKFSKDITTNLFQMKKEASAKSVDEQEIYNNVMKRVGATYQFERSPILDAMARASSVFHLGIAPSFLLTNMTQPWMITMPQLAGRFGAANSASAMRSAWSDSARIIRQGKGGTMFNLADVDFNQVKDPSEKRLLNRLADLNKLAGNQVLDMGMLADGASPRWIKANKAFAWATHHIELVNRISTALATYRLERARNPNASESVLISKAVDMVDKTQLDYSGENAAPFMHTGMGTFGKLKKLIFQFRKYQQGMLYLLFRNGQLAANAEVNAAIARGDTKSLPRLRQEAKEAKGSLLYLGGMQLAFAGAVGIPASNVVLGLLNMLLDDDDEDGDAETQIRNYLSDTIGPDAARAFWKGLPTMLGLDISRNIGMGSLFDPLPMARWSDITAARTGKSGIAEFLYQSSGATAGMVGNVYDGVKYMADGQLLKGMGKIAPKFIGSLFKAADLKENGIVTRSGNEVIPPSEFDAWDIAYKAMGYNPTTLTEHYEAQTAKESVSRKIGEIRNNLISEYANAKLSGDSLSEIKEQISDFNKKHKNNKIKYVSLQRAVTSRRKGREELDKAGVRYRKQDKGLEGINRFAY